MREHGLSHAVAGNLGALVPTTDRHNPATYTRQAPRMLAAAAALYLRPAPILEHHVNVRRHKLPLSGAATPEEALISLPSSIPPLIGTPASRAPLRGMPRGAAIGRNGHTVGPPNALAPVRPPPAHRRLPRPPLG